MLHARHSKLTYVMVILHVRSACFMQYNANSVGMISSRWAGIGNGADERALASAQMSRQRYMPVHADNIFSQHEKH